MVAVMDGGGCSLCSLEEEFTFDENEERKEEKAMRKQKKKKMVFSNLSSSFSGCDIFQVFDE